MRDSPLYCMSLLTLSSVETVSPSPKAAGSVCYFSFKSELQTHLGKSSPE